MHEPEAILERPALVRALITVLFFLKSDGRGAKLAQFPVPSWDRALAITESRESVNPRPRQFGHIAQLHLTVSPRIIGFSTYSEGCNDDGGYAAPLNGTHSASRCLLIDVIPQTRDHTAVNKIIWSSAGWGSQTGFDVSPEAVVSDYAKAFFSPGIAKSASDVITGLEQNWIGPLATNPSVATVTAALLTIEREMSPTDALNWRLLQLR